MIRTYTELIEIPTFAERFRYLKLNGQAFDETFGKYRYLNQKFYNSTQWRNFRRDIIVRDFGCDLASRERPFVEGETIVLHHLNPITVDDVREFRECLMDPENVIATTKRTHNAIHYGDELLAGICELVERCPNDTCPWKA